MQSIRIAGHPICEIYQDCAVGPSGKLLLCDRDGVLIEDVGPRSSSEISLIPGVRASLHRAVECGFTLIIVSNQSAIGRGTMTTEDALEIHASVLKKINHERNLVSASLLCPHAPQDGCRCRKPLPGMLNRALAITQVVPSRAVFVGDAVTDVQAAVAAGVEPFLVETGRGKAQRALLYDDPRLASTAVVPTLRDAVEEAVLRLGMLRAHP